MKVNERNLIKAIGDLENAVYGDTLLTMAEYERKDGRNELREEIMKKFGYQYCFTGINQGRWKRV